MKEQTRLNGIVLSVSNNEWYYGRSENANDSSKKVLIRQPVSESEIVSIIQVREINDLFRWLEIHERDTVKKKKRLLYIDRGFFV